MAGQQNVCLGVWVAVAVAVLLPTSMADGRDDIAPQADEPSMRKGWTAPTGGDDAIDIDRGEQLWGKCQACHTLEEGARHSVGPNLYAVFGRKAGTAEGYSYSPAMKKAGLVWTDETINDYIAATQAFMPGTKMYGGLAVARDRTDLLAWMHTQMGTRSRE